MCLQSYKKLVGKLKYIVSPLTFIVDNSIFYPQKSKHTSIYIYLFLLQIIMSFYIIFFKEKRDGSPPLPLICSSHVIWKGYLQDIIWKPIIIEIEPRKKNWKSLIPLEWPKVSFIHHCTAPHNAWAILLLIKIIFYFRKIKKCSHC